MSHCDDCQTAGRADCTCLCDGCTAARSDIILGRFAELAEARKDPELMDADLAVFAPRSEEPESVTDRLAKLALEMRDHTVRMRKTSSSPHRSTLPPAAPPPAGVAARLARTRSPSRGRPTTKPTSPPPSPRRPSSSPRPRPTSTSGPASRSKSPSAAPRPATRPTTRSSPTAAHARPSPRPTPAPTGPTCARASTRPSTSASRSCGAAMIRPPRWTSTAADNDVACSIASL